MQIQQQLSLKPYNSFGLDVLAENFAAFSNLNELEELLTVAEQQPLLILGGGSNILLTKPVDGLVLKNEINGIEKAGEDEEHIYLRVGAGENWHRFVLYCISHRYAGAENLSLIPGNVGAGPMQNIGAYGVELKDIFHSLEAWHIGDNKLVTFSKEDCAFGYRESVFKNKYRGQFIITSVTFKLNKKPVYHVEYGAITQELEKEGVTELSIAAISEAVIRIRRSKLPDPAVIGNAGSFFKNPEISIEQFEQLKKAFPAIVGYPVGTEHIKVAAGWLIEQAGWKGYRQGDAGCHEKQALVLVNYGNASGEQIYLLSEKIIHSVNDKFGISLQREVNIV
ncbi:MAG: murB [Ferruginibacter sp.]|nr:murB [Ferruginibacter sp.]